MDLSIDQKCNPGPVGSHPGASASDRDERPDEGIFVLPCGYVDETGEFHNEVEMAHPTGKDEEFFLSMSPDLSWSSVTTAILQRCVKRIGTISGVDDGLVKDLIETDREYLILKLREMIKGKEFHAVLKCPALSCGKPMDITISMDDFAIQRRPALEKFFSIQLSPGSAYRAGSSKEYREIEFRLPTGSDIEDASAVFKVDEAAGQNRLLARCLTRIGDITEIDESVAAALKESARDEIDRRMQELSPQTEFDIETACPECGSAFTAPLDIISWFFREIGMSAGRLEREVHTLALHYHWSEQEILSLTRKKRRRYIALIEESTGLEV